MATSSDSAALVLAFLQRTALSASAPLPPAAAAPAPGAYPAARAASFDALAGSVEAAPAAAAALLSTTLRCLDSGLLPHADGLPIGALTASKRKLLAALAGSAPSGYGGELLAAGAALDSAVRALQMIALAPGLLCSYFSLFRSSS